MARNIEAADDTPSTEPILFGRRTWLLMIVGIIVIGVGILYLTQASKDAMKEVPSPNASVEATYLQRCGSCHAAPPAKDFAKWERDWDRMAAITMFMPGEQEKVHHYLDNLRRSQ